MSFPRLSFLLIALLGCSRGPEPKVILDCSEFEAVAYERLGVSAARQAYHHAETIRELRYREAIEPGYFLRVTRDLVDQKKIDKGQVCYEHLFSVGRLLFEHEYNFTDGLGRDDAKTRADPFRKVHDGALGGPETNSCTSCHWRGGLTGSGAVQDNSQLFGDGTNISSADARNPPALLGVGVAQLLAQEMSAELQAQKVAGIKKARKSGDALRVELRSKGTEFGSLAIAADGRVDTAKLVGIDSDLVVKPFGWRGEFATIRDFVMTSTQVHLGIQSEDLIAAQGGAGSKALGKGPVEDPDGDGVVAELSAGQVTALVSYLSGLELPVVAPPKVLREFPAAAEGLNAPLEHNYYDRFTEGQRLFDDIGCALCHTPMMVLDSPIFATKSEVTGQVYSVDLSKKGEARLRYSEALGGYPVWLFSDLKRHDLGEGAIGKHVSPGIKASSYLTRRLWGVADSSPYFYDGRAPTFDEAIAAHGGEGAFARDEFADLTAEEKGSLRLFLLSLRRTPRLLVP